MAKKTPTTLTPHEEQLVRARFGPDVTDVSDHETMSAQTCTLCGGDRGPLTVVFDGQRQLSICATCLSEGGQA
ncbi:MAG: hypothetical protein OET44_12140 [Gammaproteobacteria bacterium]|nr:hypothetical protein [Gammaproteobacteria bacterium]